MPSTGVPVIQTRGLTKRYGSGVLAVDRLDLAVERGEVHGFLGPNGAGKTTTLRMLLGLIRPTAGTASVAGHPAGDPRALARVGSMVEDAVFYPHLSGRDNLRVVARCCGLDEAAVERGLRWVGLEPAAHYRFKAYSTGMRQRLGLAAALIKDPEVLILDEPSNGLDPEGMVWLRQLLRGFAQERAVLISSHLLAEAEQVCDRVAIIQSGRLIHDGPVSSLRSGGTRLEVEAAPLEAAALVVERMLGPAAVSLEEGRLLVAVASERAAEINRALVMAGVEVSGLQRRGASLEEAFLRLTAETAAAPPQGAPGGAEPPGGGPAGAEPGAKPAPTPGSGS
ncbi:MAG TPA: ABC transporter ATP-binding protein [Candidatus Binatia bacterium]|nr:ABC transporter ATP-binding protein [Candidatus Binatia bacterium]